MDMIRFLNRDFGTLQLPHDVELDLDELTVEADGGPRDALIRAIGAEESLWQLMDLLRCPVEIEHSQYGSQWWGYVSEVELILGAMSIGARLDEMTNRIRIIYNEPSLYGPPTQRDTGWQQDDESVAMFGYKELRLTAGDLTPAGAAARLARELEQRGRPRATPPTFGTGNQVEARIRCRGWLDTLTWRYYTQTKGLEAHAVNGDAVQKLGQGWTGAGIGFSANGSRIHAQSGNIAAFKKGDRLRISGASANNGIVTVASSTNRTPASYTATTIAGTVTTKRSRVEDSAGALTPALGAEGSTEWPLTIQDSGAGNNGTYTVKGFKADQIEIDASLHAEGPGVSLTLRRPTAPGFPDRTYTASTLTITSGYIYRLTDSAGGMDDFAAGDMILVSGAGAGANAGWYRVVSASSEGEWLEVDRPIVAVAAGGSVTIARGSAIQVEEALTDLYPGDTITVQIEAEALRQSTTPSVSGWNVGAIAIKAKRVGTPADALRIALYTNASGNPGALLDSVEIAGATLPENATWLYGDLTNTATINAATTYHVVVERTGAISHENYYEITVEEAATYAAGDLRIKVAGAWGTGQLRTPDADMPFRLIGYRQTTDQIRDIVAACGPFLADVEIRTASGLIGPQYREGERTALDELRALLEQGTVSGERLVCRVAADRRLIVETEAAAGDPSATYRLDRLARLRSPFGAEKIPLDQVVVGVWADLELPSAQAWQSGIIAPGRQFIERVTLKPGAPPQYGFRNQEDRFDIGGIRDG